MNEFEEYIEKLQNLSHKEKIKIMWIGVPIIMLAIIFVWFSFTDFSFKKNADIKTNEEMSKLTILKNGFNVTLQEAGNLLKDFKEKINQTYSFEITAPIEKTSDVSITSLEVATTTRSNVMDSATTTGQ